MSDTTRTSTARRRHDAAASRRALLNAAAALFDERGYDRTTVRDIGERAGVDAALIARYFGGKEGLYLATLTPDHRPPLPAEPAEALGAILTRSDERGIGPVALAMVNPALTDAVREEVRRILGARVLEPLGVEMASRDVPEAELRAELLVAVGVGIALARAGGTLPRLQGSSLASLLAVLDPVVERLTNAPGEQRPPAA
jgi:AcrR family transcriptional regulator